MQQARLEVGFLVLSNLKAVNLIYFLEKSFSTLGTLVCESGFSVLDFIYFSFIYFFWFWILNTGQAFLMKT